MPVQYSPRASQTDLRQDFKLFSLQLQELLLKAPQKKKRIRPRRSSSFAGVVCVFPELSRTTSIGPGEEEEENLVEEGESYGTEGVPSPVWESQGTGGPMLAQYKNLVSHQSEPSLLAIMQQMTQIMAHIQANSSSEASRPQPFNTLSMKAPEFFDGTQPSKVRSFIQFFELIFHNDLANFSQYSKRFLYETSFLICRATEWIEPYLPNLTNKDPRYLLSSWTFFESQLLLCLGTQIKLEKLKQSWIP
ncbi:hypothetical protein O181_016074 [Austropuccinia psidii MF-1]|uniref:DUF4939 domain-containing protein n=1 Tax=Austropuccinia psidii MF-1 TaxID=1389203 RepID=A0A9Q3C356_9BASI|nr:hypothetical protein [Austropuccinia psidii MF-1]